jgi:hypothetical protein
MTNEQSTSSKRRKIISFAVLGFLFIVLPGISWYYLHGGKTWRKEAVAELGNYGKVRAAWLVYPDGEKVNLLNGCVTVVHIFGENPDLTENNKKIIDVGQRLFDQFGTSHHFRLAMIAEGGTSEFRSYVQKMPSIDYATWVWTGALGGWRTIVENGYESYNLAQGLKPVPEYFALADSSGQIRRFYDALDEKQVGRMVEQIAILLPKE